MMRSGEILPFIRERLQSPLPGLGAQLLMAPNPRPGDKTYLDVGDNCSKAGVLLLLYKRRGSLFFPLTRRTETVLHHRGQISLPGGEQHPDETPVETALRETEEEMGAALSDVQVLGLLTPLFIPHSNFCVRPVVASTRRQPEWRPRPEEVAKVIEAPLDRLLDTSSARREIRQIEDRLFEVPFFDFDGHKVWGATAMILAEFAALFDR